MIKDFYHFKDWYKESYNYFMSRYNDEIFISLVCATSPRKSVKANLRLAEKLYLNYLNGIEIFKGIIGILPAHKNNILRSINGEALSGEKVRRFYENLTLNLDVVTIDVWIKKYFGLKESLTPLQYLKAEKKIKNNAKRHNLKPAEYQAVIWNVIRAREGFKPSIYAEV